MGKKSKTKDSQENLQDVTMEEQLSYEDKVRCVVKIAKPLATKHLAKRVYKLIKKATKQKTFLRAGLKDVQRRIRMGERGVVIFAGDVTPIDVICHMPYVCEENNIPYCYTPSRADLGAAMGVTRGTVMVLIREHPSYQEAYDEVYSELKKLPIPLNDAENFTVPQDKL